MNSQLLLKKKRCTKSTLLYSTNRKDLRKGERPFQLVGDVTAHIFKVQEAVTCPLSKGSCPVGREPCLQLCGSESQ